jgi:hypothetical protein
LEIPLAKKTSTASGTARNVGSTINRKASTSKGNAATTVTLAIAETPGTKQQVRTQGTQTTAGMPKPVETSEEEGMYYSRDAEAGAPERLTAERTTQTEGLTSVQ